MTVIRRALSRCKHALLPLRMRWALRDRPDVHIVEVGANDGKTGDPVYGLITSRPLGRALLIEPVPHLFERLRESYAGVSRCTLANVAVGAAEGKLTLHYIDPGAKEALPQLPPFYEELASFNRAPLEALLGAAGAEYLREVTVDALPLDQLLIAHGFDRVDLLQIDTEGFDYQVLKTFPFDTLRPRLVCFEHSHLSEADRAAAVALVREHGYRVERWGKDLVCVR